MPVSDKYVGHGVKKNEVARTRSMRMEMRYAYAILIWKQITLQTCA
jgi:hypothetical protein